MLATQERPALREHLDRILAEAPPLTDEQRTRLAELLRPARQSGGRIK